MEVEAEAFAPAVVVRADGILAFCCVPSLGRVIIFADDDDDAEIGLVADLSPQARMAPLEEEPTRRTMPPPSTLAVEDGRKLDATLTAPSIGDKLLLLLSLLLLLLPLVLLGPPLPPVFPRDTEMMRSAGAGRLAVCRETRERRVLAPTEDARTGPGA